MPRRVHTTTGAELFIVDNSDDEWKALRYLRDWCQISTSIDVATAYFEIGSLLALDGAWQKTERIRVLMGDEVAARTKKAIVLALRQRLDRLDSSIEREKEKDDFLEGLPTIVAAIRDGRIVFRVYRKKKFHAKAYITHAKLEVVGAAALVGSSNFTYPGITENVELNVQITGQPVRVLQDWYEEHWAEAEDVSEEVLRTIERHVREYAPFDVWAKSLLELFRGRALSAGAWERTESRMWPLLDGYQREGYGALLKIARHYGGGFLCDGVGLGKTFIGLMVIERLIMHDRKNVLLLVPKSINEAVWRRDLRRHLPDLADGVFTNLFVLNHTDLSRDAVKRQIDQAKARADAIVIDEAHAFRNPGIAGTGEKRASRYRVLKDLAVGKELYLLTATPVNNRLLDLMHMIELFADDATGKLRQPPLGLHSLRGHFRKLEREIDGRDRDPSQMDLLGMIDQSIVGAEAQARFLGDPVVQRLVVQRSRAYVKESQSKESRGQALFPRREDPRLAPYRLSKPQRKLLDMVERAFSKARPLFSLASYYPAGWLRKAPVLDDFIIGRQRQVVSLIRTTFLKRLESSTIAFDYSCQNLLIKLLAWAERHVDTKAEKNRLTRWRGQREETLAYVKLRQDEWHQVERDAEEDLITPELLEQVEELSRDEFKVDDILDETFLDLDQLTMFIEALRSFSAKQDGKLVALVALLKSDPVLSRHKVLLFTEYMTTARYLREELRKAGIEGVDQIDSASKGDRIAVLQRFSPYYNDSSSSDLERRKVAETRVLVSTDVFSEGLNLQDATRLINYELHWNPVRLMQRIGRVDRRLDPEVEARIVADHPEQAELRGKVAYWNFLPPAEIDRLLTLYQRVAGKTLRISRVFGIEGRKLLTPEDDYEALREFNHDYEGDQTPEEKLRQELRELLTADPELEAQLDALPGRVFSGRAHPRPGARAVFLCYALPGRKADAEGEGAEAWTTEDGETRWYLYELEEGRIADEATGIAEVIRSERDTPRRCAIDRSKLREARLAVERHIRNGYLKQVQAPMGVVPLLRAWMELN